MPKKLSVMCELGNRQYTEEFTDKAVAATFVQLMFRDEIPRWNSSSEATAKGGVLVVKARNLEELIELTETKPVSDEVAGRMKAFRNGKWENVGEKKPKKAGEKKAKSGPAGLVTLLEICKRNKWTPRMIRMKLRASKTKKPASGSWAWPSNEAAKVEKSLKELMK